MKVGYSCEHLEVSPTRDSKSLSRTHLTTISPAGKEAKLFPYQLPSHWIRLLLRVVTPHSAFSLALRAEKALGQRNTGTFTIVPWDLGDLQHGQRGYGWDNSSICQKWKEGIEAKWSIPLILYRRPQGRTFTGQHSPPWWRWLRIHTTWLILAHDVSCPGSLSGCRLDLRASKQDRHAKLHNLMPCPQYVPLRNLPSRSLSIWARLTDRDLHPPGCINRSGSLSLTGLLRDVRVIIGSDV